MSIVQANISMSLDGFVTGPNVTGQQGLGEDGEILHAWLDEERSLDLAIGENRQIAGAVITSRKVYEMTDGWGWDGFYHLPVYVVTHRPHHPVSKRYTSFVFVGSVEEAVTRSIADAKGKVVHLMGGATIVQQALAAGLVDELFIHVAPIVLTAGTRLFDNLDGPIALERIDVVETRNATHLRYRVLK